MHNFAQVDWGPDEAKDDANIPNYFFPISGFSEIVAGKIRYVIGRKGSGKTAIIERIKNDLDSEPLAFYSQLSLRNFPVNLFSSLQDRSKADKSKYVSAWQFILYVELSKLILRDQGALPFVVVEELRSFLSINSFDSELGFSETVTILTNNQNQVSIKAGMMSAFSNSGGGQQNLVKVHYTKVVEVLSRLIGGIESESEYRLFFDELDEGYKSDDDRINLMILALIRAVEDTALFAKKRGMNFNPLLVLRSDIFDLLEDNDLNKIDDYSLKLKWSLAPEIASGPALDDEKLMTLRNVVNNRISASVPMSSAILDVWHGVVHDLDPDIPHSVGSLWKYIANRTFERPRDILKFLKYARLNQKSGKLTYAAIEQTEVEYSGWLYNEIRDEIQSHLKVWSESLNVITRIGRGIFTYDEFLISLNKEKEIVAWLSTHSKDPLDIANLLFRNGVIGNLGNDGKRWLFGYKDSSLAFDSEMKMIVHYGLHKKLRLTSNKQEYLKVEAWN